MSFGGFFYTVRNDAAITDKSWAGFFENCANGCRAPAEWVSAECCNSSVRNVYEFKNDLTVIEGKNHQFKNDSDCLRITRVLLGLVLGVFGVLLALPLMGLAYTSAEIRLKHSLAVRTLTPEEQAQLRQLVNDRKTLQASRKGCDGGASCILCSICCLLCTLVCRRE